MSEINFGGNNTFNNSQLGDQNKMNIIKQNQNAGLYMTKHDWDELKDFIQKESNNHSVENKDAQEVLSCTARQDEQGLKKILTNNGNSLLLNIIGSAISTGLIVALKKLCGLIT